MRTLPFLTLFLIACGGTDGSDVFIPLPADAGIDANNMTGDGSNGTDGGPGCDPSKCGITVPAGFRLATYAPNRGTSCPGGWSTQDVATGPVADPSACSCTCSVTTPPDCSAGTIHRSLDFSNSAACNQPAATLVATGGCDSIGGGGIDVQGNHYSADAPPPVGGACTYNAQPDASKVTTTAARVCQPPSSCTSDVCGAVACVAHDGDVDCPTAFSGKTLVGSGGAVDCGSCGTSCQVTGVCTGTIGMFTDDKCTQNELDFPVDSNCKAAPGGGMFDFFRYKGSLKSSTCSGTPPTSTPAPKLDLPLTVCCKK